MQLGLLVISSIFLIGAIGLLLTLLPGTLNKFEDECKELSGEIQSWQQLGEQVKEIRVANRQLGKTGRKTFVSNLMQPFRMLRKKRR